MFLWRGQLDGRAVSALEAGNLHRHLLALEARGETQEHHDGVGLLRDRFGVALERFVRAAGPDELEARVAVRFAAHDPDAVRSTTLETERVGLRQSWIGEFTVVRRIVRPDDQAVVEIELELHGADEPDAI